MSRRECVTTVVINRASFRSLQLQQDIVPNAMSFVSLPDERYIHNHTSDVFSHLSNSSPKRGSTKIKYTGKKKVGVEQYEDGGYSDLQNSHSKMKQRPSSALIYYRIPYHWHLHRLFTDPRQFQIARKRGLRGLREPRGNQPTRK